MIQANSIRLKLVKPLESGNIMRLGLRRQIGQFGGTAVFNPATLNLSGWWRANYTGSPWVPTASAGNSGTNGNLAEATNPPTIGASQNAKAPAEFNGTNQIITTDNAMTTYLGNSAGSVWGVFRASAAAVDAGAGLRIDNKGLVYQDTGGTVFGIGYSASGVTVAYYDTGYRELVADANINNYHLFQVKWNATTLSLRVDSLARTTIAVTALTIGASPLVLGKNYATNFQACRMEEIGTSLNTFSDTQEDNIKSYVNATYGLSL